MIALLGCQLIGCWRIAEADLWHREHLGLGGLGGLDILKAKRDLFFNSLLVLLLIRVCIVIAGVFSPERRRSVDLCLPAASELRQRPESTKVLGLRRSKLNI